MKNDKIFNIILAVVIAVMGFTVLGERGGEPLGAASYNKLSAPTNSSTSVGVAETTVLSAKGGRKYVRITNDHATNVVYLYLGSGAALNKGIRLGGTESYEIDADNLYDGIITGITSSTTTVTTVEE